MAFSIQKLFWVVRTYCFYFPFFIKKIGAKSYLGHPLYISGTKGGLSFGDMVRIYPGARIEICNHGRIALHSNVSVGNSLHLYCSKEIVIGNDVLISSSVFISDTDHSFENIETPYISQPIVCKPVYIGDGAFIGHGSTVLPGSHVGKHCIIGANSLVKGVLPDYTMWAGVPAKQIKIYNFVTKKWEKSEANK